MEPAAGRRLWKSRKKNVDINKKNKDVVSYQDRIGGNNIKNEIGKRKKRIKMENIEIPGMMEVK